MADHTVENVAVDVEQEDFERKSPALASMQKFLLGITLTGIVPIFTGIAYLVGGEYHHNYLTWLRVPSLLIEKSTADYFLFAYSAFTSSLLRLAGSAGFIVLALVFFYAAVWRGFNRLNLKVQRSERAKVFRERVKGSESVKVFADVIVLPLLITVITFYALLILLFALVLPPYIGEAAGKRQAEKDLAVFKLGCEKARGTYRFCTQIRDGETVLSHGFIIDISNKYVAVYETGGARIIPIEGKNFLAPY